ncbi:ImmA/IrrE family metallo-endopeptidase [Listeria costaricensis]|uniref:ImmA/IrrE family metallo-endopeptidase n=1 Tax=Listeria costaricensis TaxID=2026604 RepID=UPI000C0848EC|nr:ImmA/IrrE family metallo-endopeptidase [Listeria costaricensis]
MYDDLMNEYGDKVPIKEEKMPAKLPGLFLDGMIFIDQQRSAAEKSGILIEELMHWKYSVGNIFSLDNMANIKQENFARKRGYEELVSIEDIITCFYANMREYFEVAEYLGVTEEFLRKTVSHYKEKFGPMYHHGRYIINFGNTIDVYKKY